MQKSGYFCGVNSMFLNVFARTRNELCFRQVVFDEADMDKKCMCKLIVGYEKE